MENAHMSKGIRDLYINPWAITFDLIGHWFSNHFLITGCVVLTLECIARYYKM